MDNNGTPAPKLSFTSVQLFRFLAPSLLGAFLFMMPVRFEGNFIIPIAVIVKTFNNVFAALLPYAALGFITISAVFTIIAKVIKPKFIMNHKNIREQFDVSAVWIVLRVVGLILAIMVFFQIGPSMIISADSGQFILFDLIGPIMAIALFAAVCFRCCWNSGFWSLWEPFCQRFSAGSSLCRAGLLWTV